MQNLKNLLERNNIHIKIPKVPDIVDGNIEIFNGEKTIVFYSPQKTVPKSFDALIKEQVLSCIKKLSWTELIAETDKYKYLNALVLIQVEMYNLVYGSTGHGIMDEDVVLGSLSAARIADEDLEKNSRVNIKKWIDLFYLGAMTLDNIAKSVINGLEWLFEDVVTGPSDYSVYKYAAFSYVKQVLIDIIANMTEDKNDARMLCSKLCRRVGFISEDHAHGTWFNKNTDRNRIVEISMKNISENNIEKFSKLAHEYSVLSKSDFLNDDFIKTQLLRRQPGWNEYKDKVVEAVISFSGEDNPVIIKYDKDDDQSLSIVTTRVAIEDVLFSIV